MPSQTLSITLDNSSDAAFRAWATVISNALSAAGFVQTADTGQINLATVVRPAAINTSAGYQIWRFADTLQATAPIFFKIEYGSNPGATTAAEIWITAGTGSNGAGTITGADILNVTGALTSRFTLLPSLMLTTAVTLYINSDGSTLMMASVSSATSGFMCLIERTRAFDGTAVGDGFLVLSSFMSTTSGSLQAVEQLITYLPGMPTSASNTTSPSGLQPAPSLNSFSSLMFGTTVYTVPLMTGAGVKLGAPSQYVMAIMAGDYPGNTSVTISHYGTNHTWRTAGPGNSGWGTFPFNCKSFVARID